MMPDSDRLTPMVALSDRLELGDDGVWFVSAARERVSFPEGGLEALQGVEARSVWFRHRNSVIRAAVAQFPLPAQGIFLDVGAGNGFVARGLADDGVPVVAIEPDPAGARYARSLGLEAVCATTWTAGFEEGAFAGLGLFDVLEHIEDDEGFLRHLWTLCAPDGRLFMTVPAYQVLWSRADEHAGHFRRYTRRRLASVVRSAGFEVEYLTYFFSPLPGPLFVIRSLPYRLGLQRRDDHLPDRAVSSGRVGRAVERLLSFETHAVKARRVIPVGGSCLLVARRPG